MKHLGGLNDKGRKWFGGEMSQIPGQAGPSVQDMKAHCQVPVHAFCESCNLSVNTNFAENR